RERLFRIIEELVLWENSTNEEVLCRARAEILASNNGEMPPVYDPFSGGGSIPLEAQRLGLPAYGSDLNPVAVMIGKAMIEIPPLFKDQSPINPDIEKRMSYRNAEGLAADVKYYGEWMREKAFERIGHLYPQVDLPAQHGGGKANVIAWIWARTVPSPDPALNGLPVPLVRSFDLSTKKGKEVWVEPIIECNDYRFEIRSKAEGHVRHDMAGTVERNGAICLVSGSAMPLAYVREQAMQGNMQQKLMAVVAEGKRGRVYVAPSDEIENKAFGAARPEINDINLPEKALSYRIQAYGMKTYGDLFTDRQLVALNTFSELVHEAREQIEQDALAARLSHDPTPLRDGGTGAKAYAEAVSVYLANSVSKLADYNSTICGWIIGREVIRNTFARQAIPMTWDFAEVNVFSNSTGNWMNGAGWNATVLQAIQGRNTGVIKHHDAQTVKYPPNTVISTDPPYYDNIGYADLSDFFFCWMKPALKDVYPDPFGVMATPKNEELVATPYRHGGKGEAEDFFLTGMGKAIKNMAEQSHRDIPATIYYAFKQSEVEQEGISSTGWATFLQAVIEAGYAVVGTWPMRTEMANRMIASGTNALANSVVLVCRQRGQAAPSITRAEFIRELQREMPPAIEKLKSANIAPADIPQSSIGPGIGIFSRYTSVLESDDTPMSVKTALQLINAELGDSDGDFDTDTSFALTWFEQHGFKQSDFGTANNIANAKGISVESLVHAEVAESSGGKFRLLPRNEMDAGWDPRTDTHLTIWECCQHLIRIQQEEGDTEAAKLMKLMGPEKAEAAKELAYNLYEIATTKRNDAKEGTAYNGLIAAWGEISAIAASLTDEDFAGDRQMGLI
ncbi:hypothetical protein N9N58_04665, partial [Alphaproteobacteria bacterium]|nr:hypothetical protein [Alphaproteobacteria bacterium]